MLRNRDHVSVEATDAITCATVGTIDSVTARFSFRLGQDVPSDFVDSLCLNGLPVTPDRIIDGVLHCMVLEESGRGDGYGTGHLYRDLVSGKDIEVRIESNDVGYVININKGDLIEANMTVIYDSQTCMRGYVNERPWTEHCLFSGPPGLEGGMNQCSIVGCGRSNPCSISEGRTG